MSPPNDGPTVKSPRTARIVVNLLTQFFRDPASFAPAQRSADKRGDDFVPGKGHFIPGIKLLIHLVPPSFSPTHKASLDFHSRIEEKGRNCTDNTV
jgi:hypothetical protein